MTDPASHLTAEYLQQELAWAQRLARGLVRDASEADDLVQEAWLQGLGRSWPTGHPPRSWMKAALRSLARLSGRGRARRLQRELAQPLAEPAPSAEQVVLRVETCRALVDGLLHLPDPYRDVLFLRYVEERSVAEIAELRGNPAATVRSQSMRGLALLRERLDDRIDRHSLSLLAALSSSSTAGLLTVSLMNAKPALLVAALVVMTIVGYRVATSSPDGSDADVSAVDYSEQEDVHPPQADTLIVAENASSARAPQEPEAVTISPSAPLALRVVDARTGESVGHLRLALEDVKGEKEELVTDAFGRFTSARSYPSQSVTLHLLGEGHPDDIIQTPSARAEARRYSPSVTYNHAASSAGKMQGGTTLEVPVGPTLSLLMAIPMGYGAQDILGILTTREASNAFDKLFARGVVTEDNASIGIVCLRFAPLAHLIGGGAAMTLRLGTVDGAWYAELDVESPYGLQSTENVTLEPRAGLRGRLLNAAGEPLQRQFVQLHPEQAPDNQDNPPRPAYALANDEGEFVFRWLHPGSYSLRVNAEGAEPFREEIVLQPGPFSRDVQLVGDRFSRKGRIAGTVTSSSGRFRGPVHGILITTKPEEFAGSSQSITIQFDDEKDGFVTGHFSMDGLREDAEYQLMLTAEGFSMEPNALQATPGDVALEFYVHDLEPTRSLDIRAQDSQSGASLTAFEVRLSFPNPAGDSVGGRSLFTDAGLVTFDSIPGREPFAWIVTATGYAPAFGTASDASKEGRALSLSAQLEPGWGAKVFVLTQLGEPLDGAHILLDGLDQGVTDTKGFLHVYSPKVPSRLEVRLDGWTQLDKTPSNTNTPFRPWEAMQTIRMRAD